MDPGHLCLLTGLVLWCLHHLHHPHQFEMASRTLRVKMSGKADSTSTRFLTCHLQSHMYQQPRVIPVNWQELKAGVDPTEEKGVPRPYLPSPGDLCLFFSSRTQGDFCCCPLKSRTPSLLVFTCLQLIGYQEERRVMWHHLLRCGTQLRNAPVHML